MVYRILVHPILVFAKEHVVGSQEADIQEVSCERLEGGVYGLEIGAWQSI